jgi:hypothetical protein
MSFFYGGFPGMGFPGSMGIGNQYGWGGGFGSFAGFSGMQRFASPFSAFNPYGSYARAGSSSYMPNLQIGEKGYGYDVNWSQSGAWNPWSNASAYASHRSIYEYEKNQAVDYKFQLGQQVHNKDVQTSVQTILVDPVIFDLNGDGKLDVTAEDNSSKNVNDRYSTTSTSSGNRRITTTTHEWDTLKDWNNKIDFDVNGDGAMDRTQWLKSGTNDGFLTYDVNNDGKVSGNELMNESSIEGKANVYKSGWEKARALGDKDGDGILKGDELNSFSMWVDKNGDGVTDTGEMQFLKDMGICEVNTTEGSFVRRKEIGQESYAYSSSSGGRYGNPYGGGWYF